MYLLFECIHDYDNAGVHLIYVSNSKKECLEIIDEKNITNINTFDEDDVEHHFIDNSDFYFTLIKCEKNQKYDICEKSIL